MGFLTLVTSLVLICASVVIFLLKPEQINKLNLTQNWTRAIAMIILVAGLWLLLHFFGEKATNNIIADLMSKVAIKKEEKTA